MEKEALLKNVKLLLKMHSEGFLSGELMPEDVLINVVPDNKLMDVLTLAMALNYQRNSYTLWESVVKAYQDETTKWIFSPNAVANSEIDILQNALLFHRVGLQPNRHPEIWGRGAIGIVKPSPKGNV
ncbi:hypothetical protein [Bacillus mycoides]|uniref:hypothetical protein n=1 Tax=Bacillus mycoides TaxID=1405 RepID=UPI0020790906|nr:hypothetical protein [Bacillus mycoides]